MGVHEGPPEEAPEVRLRDVQRERAVAVGIEPHDVARARLVYAAGDRGARGPELRSSGREVGGLILVAAERAEAIARRRDAGKSVAHALARELHRKPALVACPHAGGDPDAILRWRVYGHWQRRARPAQLPPPRQRGLERHA